MSTPVPGRSPVVAAAILLALLLALAGCGDDPGSAVPRETTSEATTSPTEPSGPTPEAGVPEELVEQAVADLSRRRDLAPEEIVVLAAEARTWHDSSLGCPEKGKSYAQALVEGYRIVLRAEGRSWPYHAGGGRGPFLCEDLMPPHPPGPDG